MLCDIYPSTFCFRKTNTSRRLVVLDFAYAIPASRNRLYSCCLDAASNIDGFVVASTALNCLIAEEN